MKIKRIMMILLCLLINLSIVFAFVYPITAPTKRYNSFLINIAIVMQTIPFLLIMDYILFLIISKNKNKKVLVIRLVVSLIVGIILYGSSNILIDKASLVQNFSREEEKFYNKIGEPEIKLFQYIEW